MAYDNEKKFALFKNDKKGVAKRPDYRGTLTLNGVEYALSAWISEKKGTNEKYMRGSVEVKQARDASPASAPAPATKPAAQDNDDSDVPF